MLTGIIAERTMGLAPDSFGSKETWTRRHDSTVASIVLINLAPLADADWFWLFEGCCGFLPRDWRDICTFDQLQLLGFPGVSPIVSVRDTGSPMDDFKQSILEMLVTILWAHKASRGQAYIPNVANLAALARTKRCDPLMRQLTTELMASRP